MNENGKDLNVPYTPPIGEELQRWVKLQLRGVEGAGMQGVIIPRNSLLNSSYIQEYVLRTKEPKKKGWDKLTRTALIFLMLEEVEELALAIEEFDKDPTLEHGIHVFTEVADVQNYGMMIQDNMMGNPHGNRGANL